MKRTKILLEYFYLEAFVVPVFYEYKYLESQVRSKLIEAFGDISKTTGLIVREVIVQGRSKTKKAPCCKHYKCQKEIIFLP